MPDSVMVTYYADARGREPFTRWLNRLDRQNQVRVAARVRRMQLGNFGDSKSLRGGLYELRIDLGPGYRVYYGKDGQSVVVLLMGGTKRRQEQDIEQAREYWRAHKRAER